MSSFEIHNPYIFLGVAGLVLLYVLYTFARKRKPLRGGLDASDFEL